eukprot:TRINITY_DN17215_c0_g1_i1.p1 TRINITY_DN17215_c0_g1~~TRINITY_DN17215_c0_g1_i1.p1  ORF type:complete len:1489 (-),score=232.87 TRINITY_DN17215_c0_g1_i1:2869-7335(-)
MVTTTAWLALLVVCAAASNRSCPSGGAGFIQRTTNVILRSAASSDESSAAIFSPKDGGEGRACRGASVSDNNPAHYTVVPGLTDLDACKAACINTQGCRGIEFIPGRCEVWTRAAGIEASAAVAGFTCLVYGTAPASDFAAVDGAVDRACRGASAGDNSAEYFTVSSGLSLGECRQECRNTAACVGIEHHSSGRCEVWTRVAGIGASAQVAGYQCYRYVRNMISTTSSTTTTSSASEAENAQFLIQATFGPTLEDLQQIGLTSYEQWLRDQMMLPSSLHRAYYRQRVAPRPKMPGSEMRSGKPVSKCQPGSRWVNHAILKSDENSPIKVMGGVLFVDGSFRSDIDLAYSGNGLKMPSPCTDTPLDEWVSNGRTCASYASIMSWHCKSSGWKENGYCQQTCFDAGYGYEADDCSPGWASLEYEGFICEVKEERVGSWVELSTQRDCGSSLKAMVVPAVWKRNAGQLNELLQLSSLTPGVLLLKEHPSSCNLGDIIESDIENPGQFYMLDQRLELKDQSSESAADQCGEVPRTFLNEKTCTLKRGCSSWTRTQVQLTLNVSTLDTFSRVGGRHVYAVTKLRPTSPPCGNISRWKLLSSTITTTQVASHATTCQMGDVGGGWELVRRTNNNLFPQTDKLVGTDMRGLSHTDPLGESFSVRFDEADFDEFLLATGDCQRWMIMKKTEVLGWYENQNRLIIKSHISSTPYNATMYRRQYNREDPWLTFGDHDHCKALYVANNLDPACDSGDLGTLHKGLNVFIRRIGTTPTTTQTLLITPTHLSTAAADALRDKLTAEQGQGWLRDIDATCSDVPPGAIVQVGEDYFQHVHLDEYNVYDFTDWAAKHPGGSQKIKQWRDRGYMLEFPSWHDMSRWETGDAAKYVKPLLVGKLGAQINFQSLPQPLQTQDMSVVLGTSNVKLVSNQYICDGGFFHPGSYALSLGTGNWDAESCRKQLLSDPSCSTEWFGLSKTNGHCWCVPAGSDCTRHWYWDGAYGTYQVRQDYAEVCRSPGEVANAPHLGHQYIFRHGGEGNYVDYHVDAQYGLAEWEMERYAKSSVWTMQALYAKDQLRQRIAWALSQIFVCSTRGANHDERSELWTNYYDIFVRNAFSSFRDVLQEVTHSPIMADYLSYKRSRSFDSAKTFPDENFAREVMQLFTIGLWQLNDDGSRKLSATGQHIPTYSQDNIRDFARVMTGFDEQVQRSNFEDSGSSNLIDPMRIRVEWHDRYPKPDLHGNFLGDGLPLCSDLPARQFLEKGAKYVFKGTAHATSGGLTIGSGSSLYAALCASTDGSGCNFKRSIELTSTLACDAAECEVNALQVVNVEGALYEYVPPACVHMFFFNGRAVRKGGRSYPWTHKCANPNARVAGISCCDGCKNRTYRWMQDEGYTCENANVTWPDMYVRRCNKDTWWRNEKWCQLACWQAGVGYDGDDCSMGAWKAARVCKYERETETLAPQSGAFPIQVGLFPTTCLRTRSSPLPQKATLRKSWTPTV